VVGVLESYVPLLSWSLSASGIMLCGYDWRYAVPGDAALRVDRHFYLKPRPLLFFLLPWVWAFGCAFLFFSISDFGTGENSFTFCTTPEVVYNFIKNFILCLLSG